MAADSLTLFDPILLLIGLSALGAGLAMAGVAWRDCTRLEIDFTLLAGVTLCIAPVIWMAGGFDGLFAALVCAGLAGAVTALACFWRPGRIGRGDIWLLAALGFLAGPDHAPLVLGLFVLFAVLTAALYSLSRGKRLFRSMFPAAAPGMAAASAALILRLGDIWPAIPVPLILAAATPALIAAGAALRLRRWQRHRQALND